jgi:hypothetical protein
MIQPVAAVIVIWATVCLIGTAVDCVARAVVAGGASHNYWRPQCFMPGCGDVAGLFLPWCVSTVAFP